MGKKKTIGAAQARGEGGTETKSPKTGTGSGGHHKATTQQGHPPPPRSAEKKKNKRGGGGTNPTHGNPRTPPHHGQPHQKVAEHGRSTRTRPRAPTPKPEKSGVQASLKPTHTHTDPPGVAG